jgi:predicted DNA-binding transcriptional regulator YafY
MLATSARLLRLLTTLQTRQSWSGRELAERIEVTERTLRRDVDRLRSLGYPVASTSGVAGGYSMARGTAMPPLMLDDDEGVAVALGLEVAALGGVAKLEEAAQRALAKLDQLLPTRAQRRIKALRSSIVRLAPQDGPTVELSAVSTLAAACSDEIALAFGYRDRAGSNTRREVEPLRVVHMERRWYLLAWDRGRADWRTFRIDRIAAPIEKLRPFVPRPAPDEDIAGYVRRAIALGPYPHRVRVRLFAPLATARARIPARYGVFRPVDEYSCMFESGGASLQDVAVWLAVLGFDFIVEEPKELTIRIQELAERLGRAGRGENLTSDRTERARRTHSRNPKG